MKLQVGVKALIANKRGEFLFLKRAGNLPDGSGIRWDVPGGRIDPSETLTEALGRVPSKNYKPIWARKV